jgi:DNA polymerase I-like protein with 3'-5' exonuclease and polymerase domains
VSISGRPFVYLKAWDGQVLTGERIAFDTETSLIEGTAVPNLALASASSGDQHCLIHPDRFGDFILAHQRRHFVFHNVAFDFWVVTKHLDAKGASAALDRWWRTADDGRMHDTMLLDMLVRLALHDADPRSRDLAILAEEYTGLEITKDDPYRLRYGELIGRGWDGVEPGFFEYAIKDPIVTWHTYESLRRQAGEIAKGAGLPRDTVDKYGLLSEAIQVRAAIALAQITRNGMHLDLTRSAEVHQALQERIAEIVGRLREMPEGAGLFKTHKRTGQLVMTPSHTPSLSTKVLREVLTRIASTVQGPGGQPIALPRTKGGAVSIAAEDWTSFAHLHPFVEDYLAFREITKLCQFFTGLREPVVHPKYTVMVRTGRTSSSGPNVQQIPRKGGLREVFVASPGHLLLAVDYRFIELCTLAAECQARYGHSTLADVIREGLDPHGYTAALLLGMDLKDFTALEQTDPMRYKQLRQNAKALNFGIPGGLGAASLVQYARHTYGVELTLDQAEEFRGRLIHDVYPELGQYLSEDGMGILARNLGVSAEDCWRWFSWDADRPPGIVSAVRNIVRGNDCRANGQPYNSRFYNNVWRGLATLNRNPDLADPLRKAAGSEDLGKKLFGSGSPR